jgi:hypothetical protein
MKIGLILTPVRLSFAVIIALSIGCSGGSSTDPDLVAGDTTSEQYTTAKPLIEQKLAEVLHTFARSTEYLRGNPWFIKPSGPTDTTIHRYDSESGWHYYYSEFNCGNYVSFDEDSVRFTDEGDPQRFPDEDTDRMDLKSRSGILPEENSDVVYEFSYNWIFSVLHSGIFKIDGNGAWSWEILVDNTLHSRTITETYENLKININEDYPHAGNITEMLTGDMLVDGTWVNYIYMVDLTIYEDHIHIRLETGRYYWEWDFYYRASPG